jgi:hypothetical protein
LVATAHGFAAEMTSSLSSSGVTDFPIKNELSAIPFHPLFVRAIILFDFNLVSDQEPLIMEWTTPQHEEIDLNCEVSSYANAEL